MIVTYRAYAFRLISSTYRITAPKCVNYVTLSQNYVTLSPTENLTLYGQIHAGMHRKLSVLKMRV
jgi:hypothetical protein